MTNSTTIKNVLLVDDDQNIRFVAQMSLEGLTPWNIVLAVSGEDALKKVEEQKPAEAAAPEQADVEGKKKFVKSYGS